MAKKKIIPAPGIQIVFTPFIGRDGELINMDVSIETEGNPIRHSILLSEDNLIDIAYYLDECLETGQWK